MQNSTFPEFGIIVKYYDAGWLQHAGSKDTNLSCYVPNSTFLLHYVITIHQANTTDMLQRLHYAHCIVHKAGRLSVKNKRFIGCPVDNRGEGGELSWQLYTSI